MSPPKPFVVAVVSTLHRPVELAALLTSLAAVPCHLRAVIVVDNGAAEATRTAVQASRVPALYHPLPENLGCGGGLRVAERLAFERYGEAFTHLWILDDDATVFPDTLELLLQAMESTGAVVAHPLTEDCNGLLQWFPGLLDPVKFRVVRTPRPPAEYYARCGDAPVPMSWSQGIALLVERAALEGAGLHRADFWVRGEDLDFSLRLTHRALGIYVPKARVVHIPPASSNLPATQYLRDAALLQNVAYVGLRLPHGRRIARTLPGNWFRFYRAWGWTPRVLWDGWRAVWWGAVRGWAAGRTFGARAQAMLSAAA